MSRILNLYRNSFSGLSMAAWMLALMMFINRAGAMVVPFLSVYLTEALGFSLKQAGIVLSLFGLGSMGGSFLGGWLTDRVGHFKVQFGSLLLSGAMFFVLVNIKSFEGFAVGVFFLALIADCLRPANSASVVHYARPENVTRAFSLNRMAMNLGFSIGPALGGLLATFSYYWLFLADGFTCIGAGLFFYFYFRRQRGFSPQNSTVPEEKPAEKIKAGSPYLDLKFVLFSILCCGYAVIFFQFISTLPLYYRQVYALPESGIGMLLALNGIIVFSLEMVLVYIFSSRFKPGHLMMVGTLFAGLSFVMLNWWEGSVILYLAMAVLSISEILAMPFMATVAVQRSVPENRGAYMGMYALSYAVAHVVSPYLGTSVVAAYGFRELWYLVGIMSLIVALGFYLLVPKLSNAY